MKIDWKISSFAVLGFLAFFLINRLLDGRVPEVLRLTLGVWVMNLFYYPISEGYKRVSFKRHALTVLFYTVLGGVAYYLVKLLWHNIAA
jgi:hypothetical protein